MERLNLGWLLDNKIAGHSAPMSDNDLGYLRSKEIRAVVRMTEKNKARVTTKCLDYLVSEGSWQNVASEFIKGRSLQNVGIEHLTIDSDEAQAGVVLIYTDGSEEYTVPFLVKEHGKWKTDR